MTELKPVSKAVLADASELHEERGECDLTQLQACLLIATAALSRAESIDGIDDDTRRNVKRARKLIGEYLPSAEVNDTAERKGLDLGQYAHTKVFDGNAKRVEKFARLMGGAASTGANDAGHPAHHNTFAPDSKTTKRIAHEIEDQFNAAVQHKGKKGLGS